VSAEHPDVVARLREVHEAWWARVEPGLAPYCPIVLGDDAENPARLDAFDVLGDVTFVQSLVARGARSGGTWAVEFARAGRYRFELRRWPDELDWPMDGDISPEAFKDLIIYWPGAEPKRVVPVRAELSVFDQTREADVDASSPAVSFELDIDRTGPTRLDAHFLDAENTRRGAYYVYVTRLE
jgi:hypothetical protein